MFKTIQSFFNNIWQWIKGCFAKQPNKPPLPLPPTEVELLVGFWRNTLPLHKLQNKRWIITNSSLNREQLLKNFSLNKSDDCMKLMFPSFKNDNLLESLKQKVPGYADILKEHIDIYIKFLTDNQQEIFNTSVDPQSEYANITRVLECLSNLHMHLGHNEFMDKQNEFMDKQNEFMDKIGEIIDKRKVIIPTETMDIWKDLGFKQKYTHEKTGKLVWIKKIEESKDTVITPGQGIANN